MTEKRFSITQGYTDRVCYDWQNNQLLNFRETVDLLNELAEENMVLKGENAHYKLLLMSLEETAKKFCEVRRWNE